MSENSFSSEPASSSNEPTSSKKPLVRAVSAPEEVPVFNCLVYVSKNEQGMFLARSATLEDLQGEGDSERDALQQVVERFKVRVAKCLAETRPIPWLDQPKSQEPEEQQRFVAVHL